jgi:hypothetical protein
VSNFSINFSIYIPFWNIIEKNKFMIWIINEHEEYSKWFELLAEDLQDEILAVVGLLEIEGPTLGRPRADTL